MLEVEHLKGKRFLDVGCGSGLFSLAARQLGARVHSFDVDEESVVCAQELKRRYFPDDRDWAIENGTIVDPDYVRSLGQFDVVYAWGVLHHTGAMWDALEHTQLALAPGGKLFVSIYNDQGILSVVWRRTKKTYNLLPDVMKLPFALLIVVPLEAKAALRALVVLRPWQYIRSWSAYSKSRGMSRWHDLIDWIGGFPFEVAKPEEVFDFCRRRGLILARLKTCGGRLGCNEFVFEKPG